MKKEYDSYFKAAALLFIKHQFVGRSLLQRKFMIGYNRAGRIFDQLADEGIIKPAEYIGHTPHELLIKDEKSLEDLLKDKDLGEQILESRLWNNNF